MRVCASSMLGIERCKVFGSRTRALGVLAGFQTSYWSSLDEALLTRRPGQWPRHSAVPRVSIPLDTTARLAAGFTLPHRPGGPWGRHLASHELAIAVGHRLDIADIQQGHPIGSSCTARDERHWLWFA
jgi:hypothetical protein